MSQNDPKIDSSAPTQRNPFWEGYSPKDDRATIHLIANPDNFSVTVLPTVAHVRCGQLLEWKVWKQQGKETIPLDEAPYLIAFRDPEVAGATEIRDHSEEARKARAGKEGRFAYKVMVLVEKKIYADVGCPSMEIKK